MTITINFESADDRHPNSDKTIADIASELEDRYGLIEAFCKLYKNKILELIKEVVLEFDPRVKRKLISQAESDMQAYWKDYILKEQHNIKTKAAEARSMEGDDALSFVDTGAYYDSIIPVLVFK